MVNFSILHEYEEIQSFETVDANQYSIFCRITVKSIQPLTLLLQETDISMKLR